MILVVAALESEVYFLRHVLRQEDEILVTGCGKVNAAFALTDWLRIHPFPDLVLNVGTAGGVSEWAIEKHLVQPDVIVQADFDTTMIETVTGFTFGSPITLDSHEDPLGSSSGKLATSDRFVTDDRALKRAGVDICDMEAYALAHVSYSLAVPFRCVKVVSDPADESSVSLWPSVIHKRAQDLGEWYEGFAYQ